MKKHFNKELVMTKKDNKDFENCTKCWICDYAYADGDVKVRDHCHMSFNINNKLYSIDSFQFLSFLLDSLVKNGAKDDFKYLSKEFDNNVLDLIKKGILPF